MSKDRNPRRRRIAFGLGTAAGASLAAAFLSMGTAGAAPETPDPFTDLGASNGSALDALVNAVLPSFGTTLDSYADNVLTTDTDAFQDFGLPASFDTAHPTLSAQLDPFADALTAGATATDHDAFVDLFGPGGAALDTAFPGISSALDPAYDAILASDADPFADVFGAANGAALDTFVNTIPIGTTTLGGFLDPFADAFLGMPF